MDGDQPRDSVAIAGISRAWPGSTHTHLAHFNGYVRDLVNFVTQGHAQGHALWFFRSQRNVQTPGATLSRVGHYHHFEEVRTRFIVFGV
jgi:hypothetical protein